MKILRLVALSIILCACSAYAQKTDADKIPISAYVAENSGVPPAATKVLDSKLRNLITSVGFGSAEKQRFILTAHVTTLTEDVTPTAPPMYAYTLSFDLYIGDGMTGTLFASTQVEAKGVGPTKDKAYLQALKALNPRDPAIKEFVKTGKDKIIEYYNMNGESIIKNATSLANNQNYDQAIWELSSIPQGCTALYGKATQLMAEFYNKQIAEEGAYMLSEAQSIWSAGRDREAADKAGAILSGINPQSPSYAKAQKLYAEISARIKEMDKREWAFELKKQQDEIDLQKATIKAARDVAVAYAENQPQPVYHVHYWW